ncbi:LexA family transcriptional regulator [Chryseobacterium phocaeense]|uniref:winged helix-turn-helix transcriptional regulator n=1 Tax=Chryseobacterium phocaeense TaxID=1816690 RepID=UPI0009B97A84|nr:winged helix-turn-helix transcriptional regulator [Chryseobacterium phocaeense]
MKIDKKPIIRNSKSLQKLTESEIKINQVLELKKITHEDIKELTTGERQLLSEMIQEQFNPLRGEERDKFYEKIEAIMVDASKNQMWEHNHVNIMWAISTLIKENNRMPTKAEIASKTDLSRQTVHKHLKEFKNSPYHAEYLEQFHIMQFKLMTTVFQYGMSGDMKAAKLYLECIGALKNSSPVNNTLIQNQNNYIQINGKVLSQETVKNLKPEQLDAIEGILKTIDIENDGASLKTAMQ